MFSKIELNWRIGAVWFNHRTHPSSSSPCLLSVILFSLHTLSLLWIDVGGWPRARYFKSVLSRAVALLLLAANTFDCFLFLYVRVWARTRTAYTMNIVFLALSR